MLLILTTFNLEFKLEFSIHFPYVMIKQKKGNVYNDGAIKNRDFIKSQ